VSDRGLSERAAGLASRLTAWPRRRVSLSELWHLLDEVDPASRIDARRRLLLADALAELDSAGLLRLPSARSYDRTEAPHVPLFVTVDRPVAPPAARPRPVWHPELSWAAEVRLTPAQMDILGQVNRWLHGHRDPLVVPLRERSLDIFGHEKTLDRLLPTNLFGTGRLTLELLRTRRALVRFTTETVGVGNELLVVENSDTFDSLVTALRRRDLHRVGTVGWGAGSAFEASVLSIRRLHPPVLSVRYFGDLDEKGLRIPASAAAFAAAEGLPPLRSAAGLYDALLAVAAPQPGQRRVPPAAAAEAARWLDPRHRERAISVLTAGTRLAQEAVGLRHLLTHDAWLIDL
jgi:hypothetical protein